MLKANFNISLKLAALVSSTFLVLGYPSVLMAQEEIKPWRMQPVKVPTNVVVKLDIHVHGTGKPLEAKLSEGQEDLGPISDQAIEEALQKTYPPRIVMAKPENYWLSIEHVPGKLSEVKKGKENK